MAAITAPGTTPAVATPTITSGSYDRTTLRARARDSSPNRGHSTSKTPLLGSAGVRRGDMGTPEGVPRAKVARGCTLWKHDACEGDAVAGLATGGLTLPPSVPVLPRDLSNES